MTDARWQAVARATGLLGADGIPRATVFAEMSALAARTGAVNLGQGFPDVDGPESVAQVVPFVHDGVISSLRCYSPSALRALAAHADPAIEVELRNGLFSPQVAVARRG